MRRIKCLPLIFLLVLEFLLLPGTATAATGTLPKMSVYYYCNNPCSSCDEEGRFYKKFYSLVGKEKEGISLDFFCYNVFHTSGEVKFNNTCDEFDIPEDKRTTPMIVLNGTPLIGSNEIDDALKSAFVAEKNKIISESKMKTDKISKPIYFFVSPCEECAEVKQFLTSLPSVMTVSYNGQQFESPVNIDSYNVAEPKNLELVKKYFQKYNVPDERQKVPVIFLKDGYLSGKDDIKNGLKKAIEDGRCLENPIFIEKAELKPYEWSGIFLTGFINGFNPCSISMLLFLVTILISRKVNVLKLGLSFIFGKFIAYLALGTLLFNILSLIDNAYLHVFSNIIKYTLLILTLILAGFNISDGIAARSEKYNKIRLQLPIKLRKINHTWLKKIGETNRNGIFILFMAFALGMVISIGEFLCTGQIYLATIIYLLKQSPELNLQMMMAFLAYILAMLIPLFIVVAAVHKGKEVFYISELARKNITAVKLINAAIFIIFAIIIIVMF